MIRKYLLLLFLYSNCCVIPVVIAEEDCVAAVDAADSMNVNQKPCDYSDKGLNGVLHRAFSKQSKASAEITADTPVSTIDQKSPILLLRAQADQWINTQLAKTQLLPQALAQCEKGFKIVAEEYRPLSMGKIEITLQYSCL